MRTRDADEAVAQFERTRPQMSEAIAFERPRVDNGDLVLEFGWSERAASAPALEAMALAAERVEHDDDEP